VSVAIRQRSVAAAAQYMERTPQRLETDCMSDPTSARRAPSIPRRVHDSFHGVRNSGQSFSSRRSTLHGSPLSYGLIVRLEARGSHPATSRTATGLSSDRHPVSTLRNASISPDVSQLARPSPRGCAVGGCTEADLHRPIELVHTTTFAPIGALP